MLFAANAPGRRDDVSHAPRRVVPAQVGVTLCVLVRYAHAELHALVHIDLPVILASDRHQVSQNRHAPVGDTPLAAATRAMRAAAASPAEGVVAEGHVTDGKIFIQVEHGEAIERQRQARVRGVFQQVEECTCDHTQSSSGVFILIQRVISVISTVWSASRICPRPSAIVISPLEILLENKGIIYQCVCVCLSLCVCVCL